MHTDETGLLPGKTKNQTHPATSTRRRRERIGGTDKSRTPPKNE